MRLLVCGLNPSLHAADAGVGFAGPSNRFWPALVEAGLCSEASARDPWRLLAHERIGMTDVVKRATPRAAELTAAEHRAGLARLEHLCTLLEPAAIVMVGLAGWRAAADRKAAPGLAGPPPGPHPRVPHALDQRAQRRDLPGRPGRPPPGGVVGAVSPPALRAPVASGQTWGATTHPPRPTEGQ